MKQPVGKHFAALLAGVVLLLSVVTVQAARVSNIASTKHNLSTSGTGSLKSTTTTEVCVFCHTPHGSTSGVTPLWNRKLSSATYTPYTSNSLDAEQIQGVLDQPGGSSKLCLSCHDGTLAIGNVNVFGGKGSATTTGTVPISMTGTGSSVTGGMADGSGTSTGFTRNLGTNLTNDHPISVTYTSTLVARDGELRTLGTGATSQKDTQTSGALIGVRTIGYKPKVPLEATGSGAENGQIQCASCHDPHIRETDPAQGNQKFLRLNRFQEGRSGTSTVADFAAANDIICLACHDKNTSGGGSWAFSAHANDQVALQTYTTAAATQREFPANLPVWRAACLNCHDTHTVPGARRLLREGTDSVLTPKQGGASAIEETCYQCHTTTGTILQTGGTGALAEVPNIKTDFGLARRMPITGAETHDIGGNVNDGGFADCSTATNKCGKDFLESRARLGRTNLANRHAECTDCHNPHRVIKGQNGLPGLLTAINTNEKAGTHRHENTGGAISPTAGYIHSNLISGVLRGAWGVEPLYTSPSFHLAGTTTAALDAVLTYDVKRGDPGTSATTTVGAGHVTREYQICLKCHSSYGYADDNLYPNSATRPALGGTGTPANSNGHSNFTTYTNQAKEFQAPSTHAVAVGSVSKGNEGGTGTAGSNANNHRSWHPVLAPTGRTNRVGQWLAPWNDNTDANSIAGTAGRLGVQTMMCSDCHGSATGTATAMPVGNTNTDENGSPWGPHGSANNFILKGEWDTGSGEGNGNTLCFKCHSQTAYSGGGGTGFRVSGVSKTDGHDIHSEKIDNPLRCNWCHVAVPHGWKNRNLLVNLLDVGAEAGLAAGTAVSYTNNVGYTNGPYYRNAFLRVISFPAAGTSWQESNCNGGSKSTMKTNCETAN